MQSAFCFTIVVYNPHDPESFASDFVGATGKSGYGNGNGKDTVWSKCVQAGRLNMTWYNSDDDLPDIDDYDIIRHKRTYRYFDKKKYCIRLVMD